MTKIGIIYKEEPYFERIATEVEQYILKKGVEVFKNIEVDNLSNGEGLILVSLGGDGTFLNASQRAIRFDAPLLGINLGNLGFLTDVEGDDIFESIDRLLRGEFSVEEHDTIRAKITNDGDKYFIAANDFILQRSIDEKILTLKVFVNDFEAGTFRCDGAIVSTAAGSTAYALSVGGPVIVPNAPVFELSFIAPHKLSQRPLILSHSEKLDIEVFSDSRCYLLRDGVKVFECKQYDRFTFEKNANKLKAIRIHGKNFFDILNKKFGWGL